VQKVEEKGFAQSLSEQAFYAKLAEVDADLPERVRRFVDKATGLGCETQLLRKYKLYLDDGLGSRLNVMSISPTGTAEVWGTASRDARLGEPAGRDYMERLAVMLPGGRVKADLPNPGSWNLRGRQQSDYRPRHAGQRNRSSGIKRVAGPGQLIELPWSICQYGTHLLQNRKARVTGPPTCSNDSLFAG
jgi:hypothetical protein